MKGTADREARMAVRSGWQGLVRELGDYPYLEPQEDHPISEQPIDVDNHAIKALCCWLYDRFGAVRGRGTKRSADPDSLARARSSVGRRLPGATDIEVFL